MNSLQKKLFVILPGCVMALMSMTIIEAQTNLTFNITRQDATDIYYAISQTTASSYSGTLKHVVESAASEAVQSGNGTIIFAVGDFNLGTSYFKLTDIHNITFAGQGIDLTILRNHTDEAADTEPFNCTNCDNIIVRDMTISAGGSVRNTSDALDFDDGDGILIERVKVIASRARGIVFDGKGSNGHADGNIVRDCIITGSIPLDGIQLLASSNNRVEGCTISGVTRHGIYMSKSSTVAPQANKPSSNNIIVNNLVMNSAGYGIAVNGGNQNVIMGNTVTNSATSGIHITTSVSIPCNDNIVDLNSASDNAQYGLRISSMDCRFNVVRNNNFMYNMLGQIFDSGTGTIYPANDTATSTPTTAFTATPISTPMLSTMHVNAVADAYISADDPSSNFGTSVSLRTDNSPHIHIYLRFEMPTLAAEVSKVVLRVYAIRALNGSYTLHNTVGSWDEETITFSNAPSFGLSLGGTSGVNANSWAEVDLTSIVTAPGQYNFVMKSAGNTLTIFSSRESSFVPQLVITYTGEVSTLTNLAVVTPAAIPTD